MGEKGVALFDITDPTQPKLKTVWTASHFAYDVSIDGARLYVAAGPKGCISWISSGDAPRTIGVARSLGFASAIVSGNGHTFILDRRDERAASHRLHSLVTEEQVKPRFPADRRGRRIRHRARVQQELERERRRRLHQARTVRCSNAPTMRASREAPARPCG